MIYVVISYFENSHSIDMLFASTSKEVAESKLKELEARGSDRYQATEEYIRYLRDDPFLLEYARDPIKYKKEIDDRSARIKSKIDELLQKFNLSSRLDLLSSPRPKFEIREVESDS